MTPSEPSLPPLPVAVITGGSRGIGRSLALGLGRKGFQVEVVVRTPEQGRWVVQELEAELGRSGTFGWVQAELTRPQEVESAAATLLHRHAEIHLLVNNAAVASPRYQVTEEGEELTLAVNHLAPARLTRALLPGLLRGGAGPGARVVNVSSSVHAKRLDLTAFEGPRGYSGRHAYAQTKLLNLLHAFDLSRALEPQGIVAHGAHPGLVTTPLLMDFIPQGPLRHLLTPLLALMAISPEDAARTPLQAATAAEFARGPGRYFRRGVVEAPAPVALDREVQEGVRIWTEGLTGLNWLDPGDPAPLPITPL